jgi:hypothetical protein
MILVYLFQRFCCYNSSDLKKLESFYQNKRLLFKEIINEMKIHIQSGFNKYLPLYCYVARSYPCISAWDIERNQIKKRMENSPFNWVEKLWQTLPSKFKKNYFNALFGSIYLSQIDKIIYNGYWTSKSYHEMPKPSTQYYIRYINIFESIGK